MLYTVCEGNKKFFILCPKKSICLLVIINFCAFFLVPFEAILYIYQWNFICLCNQISILNL